MKKIVIFLENGLVSTVITDSNEEVEVKVLDFDCLDQIDEEDIITIKTDRGNELNEYRVFVDDPYVINSSDRIKFYWKQLK